MNIGSLFSRHARYRPNHPAVVFADQRLTWSEFNRSINRLANALLGLGIRQGDKVATILPNCLEQLEVYWAVAKIGAVVVPPTSKSNFNRPVSSLNRPTASPAKPGIFTFAAVSGGKYRAMR